MVGYNPKTKEEALKLLAQKEDIQIFSGGTDLMVVKRFKENVIFINQIKELKGIEETKDEWQIGAGVTFTELIESDMPDIMKTVCSQVASPAIRNRGTLGGNICNASPAGDTLPMWYALKAKVKLESMKDGEHIEERILPIKEFILGIRKLDRRPEELLTKIIVPKTYFTGKTYFYHKKVGARRAEAISKLSFFGVSKIKDGKIESISAAFGAVGITVVKDETLEAKMKGMDKETFSQQKEMLFDAYMEHVRPIDDQRSTAAYRKKVSGNLLRDFLDHTEEKM